MTYSHLNRRVHLYLGLALLPWFLMYGVSSVVFSHGSFFERRDAAGGLPLWTLRLERSLDVAVPDDPGQLRQIGETLINVAGIHGMSYGVYRESPTQINVYAYSFWQSTQVKYFTDRRALTVEDRRFRWDEFLTGMHARGEFEQEGILPTSWAVVVDLVQFGILVWIASGLWMWWELRGHRRWGVAAILGGTLSFAWFAMRL